jgi:hypothetical protein
MTRSAALSGGGSIEYVLSPIKGARYGSNGLPYLSAKSIISDIVMFFIICLSCLDTAMSDAAADTGTAAVGTTEELATGEPTLELPRLGLPLLLLCTTDDTTLT